MTADMTDESAAATAALWAEAREPDRAPAVLLRWNWAAGVVPALVLYVAWYLVSRYVSLSEDSDTATQREMMFGVMAAVVLLAALAYLKVARSTAIVIGMTVAGGLLISAALGSRLIDELASDRRQADAMASWLGSDVVGDRGSIQTVMEYLLVAAVVCGPALGSFLIAGLRRREPRATSWNWASGAVGFLAVLLAWQTALEVADAFAALDGQQEMFGPARYSGVWLVVAGVSVAALLAVGAVVRFRVGAPRGVLVGMAVLAGVAATALPVWHTLHMWTGMEDEARDAFNETKQMVEDRIASGELDESEVPDSFKQPYEEFERPTAHYVFAVTQELGAVSIGLLALGLRRRVGVGGADDLELDDLPPPSGEPVGLAAPPSAVPYQSYAPGAGAPPAPVAPPPTAAPPGVAPPPVAPPPVAPLPAPGAPPPVAPPPVTAPPVGPVPPPYAPGGGGPGGAAPPPFRPGG